MIRTLFPVCNVMFLEIRCVGGSNWVDTTLPGSFLKQTLCASDVAYTEYLGRYCSGSMLTKDQYK